MGGEHLRLPLLGGRERDVINPHGQTVRIPSPVSQGAGAGRTGRHRIRRNLRRPGPPANRTRADSRRAYPPPVGACATSPEPAKALAYDRTRRIVGARVSAESVRLQPSDESVGSLR
jgi:hypothetical protein